MTEPDRPIYPKIGDVVLLQKAIATVMYIGPVHWNNNTNATYVGLELPEKIQNGHDGTYDNMVYFHCNPKRGIILPIDTIIKIISPRELFNKLTTFKSKLKETTNENAKLKQQIPQIHPDDDTKQFETKDDKKCNDKNEYNVLKNEFDESKQTIDILTIQNNEISEKLDKIMTEKRCMDETNQKQITELTETLQSKQNKLETLTKQIETLLTQNKMKELITQKLSIEEMNKKELNALQKTQNDLDTQSKDICIEILTEEKNGLIIEKNKLETLNNELLSKNNALIIEKDEIEKTQKQLIDKYENELQVKSNENSDLLKMNETYKLEMEQLECKCKEFEHENNALTEKIKQLENDLPKYIEKYKAIMDENNGLNVTIEQLENDIKKCIEEKNGFELMNDAIKNDMNGLKVKNDEMTGKLNDLLKGEQVMKDELVNERDEKNELNKQIEKLHFDMQQMEEELRVKYENDLKGKLMEMELKYDENIRKAKDDNINKLKILLNEQKENGEYNNLNTLLKEMSVKHDEYEQVMIERDDLKLRNSKMKKKLKTANKEKDNLLILYEKQEKQVEIAKKENVKLLEEIETNRIENKKLKKKLKKLNANGSHRDLNAVVIKSME